MSIDITDPRLSAWILGELDAEEAAVIEQAVQDQPELAEEVERLRSTMDLLRDALAEPIAGAESLSPVHREAVSRWGRPKTRWNPFAVATAMAALLAISFGLHSFLQSPPQPETMSESAFLQEELTNLPAIEEERVEEQQIPQPAMEQMMVADVPAEPMVLGLTAAAEREEAAPAPTSAIGSKAGTDQDSIALSTSRATRPGFQSPIDVTRELSVVDKDENAPTTQPSERMRRSTTHWKHDETILAGSVGVDALKQESALDPIDDRMMAAPDRHNAPGAAYREQRNKVEFGSGRRISRQQKLIKANAPSTSHRLYTKDLGVYAHTAPPNITWMAPDTKLVTSDQTNLLLFAAPITHTGRVAEILLLLDEEKIKVTVP